LSVCRPNVAAINCITNAATGSVFNAIDTGGNFCTGNPSDIEESRLSFPSGHASFSSYTMAYLIVYIEIRLFLLRLRYFKGLVQLAAFIAAYVTSVSRVSDNKHFGTDVLGGAILGVSVALFMTLALGRVLWEYGREWDYYDFDLKPFNLSPAQTINSQF
jgi:membrane-associated phospholipid phosphatase